MCEDCKWLKPDRRIADQMYMKCSNPNCGLFGQVVAYGGCAVCNKKEIEIVGGYAGKYADMPTV